MTPYTAVDTFSAVNIYDTSDPVLGGSAGESNIPVKALADRTEYLNNRQGRYLGHRIATSAGDITPADKGKLVQVVSISNIAMSLDAVAGFPVGSVITVKAKTQALGKAIKINPDGAETILDGSVDITAAGLYLHDGEMVRLVAGDADGNGTADYWELDDFKGNYGKVAKDDLVRVVPANAAIAQGTIADRADFPRLWAAVSADAVSDATWLSDIRYQGFFSAGNGSTTFRWPDMRSMFHRGLDLGRGLSVSRLDNVAGGYQADDFKSHNHITGNYDRLVQVTGFNTTITNGDNSPGEHDIKNSAPMSSAGGPETTPKNAGLIPIIYY